MVSSGHDFLESKLDSALVLVFGSWGRLPDNLTTSLYEYGNYDECVYRFEEQHCVLLVPMDRSAFPMDALKPVFPTIG